MAITTLLLADNQAIIIQVENSLERAMYMLSRIAGNLKLKHKIEFSAFQRKNVVIEKIKKNGQNN
jgi:hypothetical protein